MGDEISKTELPNLCSCQNRHFGQILEQWDVLARLGYLGDVWVGG